MGAIILFVILFGAIVYLEWYNTKLENDIELLQSDVTCEKFKSKWFTFAEREPRQNEWFIIKKRLTNDEIKQYEITDKRLMYDVYVGHLDSDNVFYGGDNFSTLVIKLDELKTQGYFWRYV
jgi:hypothetical protein